MGSPWPIAQAEHTHAVKPSSTVPATPHTVRMIKGIHAFDHRSPTHESQPWAMSGASGACWLPLHLQGAPGWTDGSGFVGLAASLGPWGL